MNRLWSHVRTLWPGWGWLSPLPLMLWPLYGLAKGEVRWEMIALFCVAGGLAFGNAATKKLYIGLYPLGLVGVLYDSMRFVKNAGITPERVHVCDLRQIELSLFGITSGGVRMTLQDWFQAHSSAWLDFVCAVPYGSFIGAAVLFAVYLYGRDYTALRRFTWSFLVLNVAAFITYHVYPAAPPWYFHAHGCVADLGARASEGPNLMRVDAAIGFSYFGGFYGRSNDVFGAVPSLHVAYPLLIVLEGWKHFRPLLRAASVLFFLTMCLAAVYLDHHWVVDVLVGLVYCVVVWTVLRFVFARRSEGEGASTPEAALAEG